MFGTARSRSIRGPGMLFPVHANAASGCRASVRATHPRVVCGSNASASCASRSAGKAANTHAPDPVIRACGDARSNACIVAATAEIGTPSRPRDHCGHNPRKRRLFSPTASCVSIPAPRRFRRSAPPPAETRAPRKTVAARPATALADAARERIFAADEKRNVGAQARCKAQQFGARQCELPQAIQREQHARGVGAAAAQPAARAGCACRGRCRRRAASRSPPAARAPRARRDRCSSGTPATSPRAADRAVVAPRERDRVGEVDQREQRLERVIAVRAASGDVQEQIDLRRRGNDQRLRHHRRIVPEAISPCAPKARRPSGRRRCAPRPARRRGTAARAATDAPSAHRPDTHRRSSHACWRSTSARPCASRSTEAPVPARAAPRIQNARSSIGTGAPSTAMVSARQSPYDSVAPPGRSTVTTIARGVDARVDLAERRREVDAVAFGVVLPREIRRGAFRAALRRQAPARC